MLYYKKVSVGHMKYTSISHFCFHIFSLNKVTKKRAMSTNPAVEEFKDVNSPTKIGEHFGSLNDNEWFEAFDAMKEENKPEGEILQFLFSLVMVGYTNISFTAVDCIASYFVKVV